MRLIAVVLVAAVPAAAQQGFVDDRGLYDRCFTSDGASVSQHPGLWYGNYYSAYGYRGASSGGQRPAGSGGSSAPGFSSGGGGKGGPEALLVLAVLVAVAAPIIVYAVDDDPDPATMARFRCPLFSLDVWGGAEGPTGTPTWVPAATARFRFASSHAGLYAQVDAAPAGVSGFSVSAAARPTPRQHLEGAITAGFRRAVLGDAVRDGLELALPHEYVFFRDGPRQLGLELKPHIYFHQRGVDIGVDAAMRLPIADFATFRAGMRAYSFDWQTIVGFNAGLALHL